MDGTIELRKKRGAALKLELYRTIFENLYDGIYFVDTNRKIIFWNKGAERITGYSASDVLNKHCYNNILAHTDDNGKLLCYGGCPLHQTIQDRQIRTAVVYLHHKEGHRVPVSVKTIPLIEDDEIIGAVEVFQTYTERYENAYSMEELKSLALQDQLTGLPNRRYTETFIRSKITEFEALGITFGILFLDIDLFKQVNDQYGHDIGDEVLKVISNTFKSSIRSTDLIGRWGGEEFVGVFVCPSSEILTQLAEKIRVLVEKSYIRVNDQNLNVTISIGATLYNHSDTFDTVLKRADGLLYASKANGRNQVTVAP